VIRVVALFDYRQTNFLTFASPRFFSLTIASAQPSPPQEDAPLSDRSALLRQQHFA